MSKKAKVIPVSFRKKASYNALEEKDQNIIGQRIQELRRQYGITLSNLSGILADYGIEISSGALNKWEVGSTVPNSTSWWLFPKLLELNLLTFLQVRVKKVN